MSMQTDSLNAHYGREGLRESVVGAIEAAGKRLDGLTREDIAALEEFHIRGREATRELARRAGLRDGTRVLDVGCGIGGPARTLAAEFGCAVTGVDVVEGFCDVAELLTDRLGLSDSVTFRRADALDLPFDDGAFEAVWLQHATMNMEDKRALFREVRRVLAPGGRLAVHEIVAGASGPTHLPVPWAGDSSINFLARPDGLRALLRDLGYGEAAWRDVTEPSLEWFRAMVRRMADRPADAPPPLGLNVLLGADAPIKVRNVVRNLEEERIRVVEAVFRRGE